MAGRDPLRRLHDDARRLLARLNELLVTPPAGAEGPELSALLKPLVDPAEGLVAARAPSRRRADEADDLGRISTRWTAAVGMVDLLATASSGRRSVTSRRDEGAAIGPGAGSSPAEAGVILVVDDKAEKREMLARSLGRQGHEVHAVDGGAEDIEALARGAFDPCCATC